jgi:NAD(P)-dependent dehydrogenase (short-subunit alcohol dehydrogenase family)
MSATTDQWDRTLALNVQGLLYVTHAALPHLVAAASASSRGVADLVNTREDRSANAPRAGRLLTAGERGAEGSVCYCCDAIQASREGPLSKLEMSA